MKTKPLPPITRIAELLDYDAQTGVFTWKKFRGGDARAGSVAGTLHHTGRIAIRIDGHLYLAHRLAWLIVTGHEPVGDINHLNGDRTDNRAANLREVVAEPLWRRAFDGDPTGVSFHKREKRFQAQISIGGKVRFLGYFATPQEARAAYLNAKRKLTEDKMRESFGLLAKAWHGVASCPAA